MKQRLWNIYHRRALETACLLLSRWIKDPAIHLVCKVATSEAQSCSHGILLCANRALKIDSIHQCNPPQQLQLSVWFLCKRRVAFNTSSSFVIVMLQNSSHLLQLESFLLFDDYKNTYFRIIMEGHQYHQWKPVTATDTFISPFKWLNSKTWGLIRAKVIFIIPQGSNSCAASRHTYSIVQNKKYNMNNKSNCII